VKWGQPGNPDNLVIAPEGYYYNDFISIDTVNQCHPLKWHKYYEQGEWPKETYLAQGCGILWRNNLPHAPIWDFTASTREIIAKEIVRLDTGLFTGNRDTEPRLGVVAHFLPPSASGHLDLFVVILSVILNCA
jgi:hypothetical protein